MEIAKKYYHGLNPDITKIFREEFEINERQFTKNEIRLAELEEQISRFRSKIDSEQEILSKETEDEEIQLSREILERNKIIISGLLDEFDSLYAIVHDKPTEQ